MQTLYYLDAETFARLESILARLYGHGEILTADKRRDLAHMLGLVRDAIRATATIVKD